MLKNVLRCLHFGAIGQCNLWDITILHVQPKRLNKLLRYEIWWSTWVNEKINVRLTNTSTGIEQFTAILRSVTHRAHILQPCTVKNRFTWYRSRSTMRLARYRGVTSGGIQELGPRWLKFCYDRAVSQWGWPEDFGPSSSASYNLLNCCSSWLYRREGCFLQLRAIWPPPQFQQGPEVLRVEDLPLF